uniref:Uncharacterized protein n=1 Tax=mine drainage metagenome TaxID=410659 RepID=E6QLZ8_9ZZZZ
MLEYLFSPGIANFNLPGNQGDGRHGFNHTRSELYIS